jgi:hypothetical protein
MRRVVTAFVVVACALGASLASALAQRPGAFAGDRDHPAIAYSTAPVHDPVATLNRELAAGAKTLAYDAPAGGYLRAVLDALRVPVASQMLAFAETSLQASKIRRENPRAVYFNDVVSVAWIRGSDLLELAAQDPTQGVVLYTLTQAATGSPRFERNDTCLACHLSWDTLAVPGYVLQTVFPRDYANGGFVDHRMPIDERWGGWFVTGARVPPRHMGNQPTLQPKPRTGPTQKLATVQGEIDISQYLTPHSDVTALLVFDHQVHAANLMTRLNWEARAGTPDRVEEAVDELTDYLLFVDEAPIPGRATGTSGFAEAFVSRGPKGPVAPRPEARGSPDAVSPQLHDLHAHVRRAAAGRARPRALASDRRPGGHGHSPEIRTPHVGAARRHHGDRAGDQTGVAGGGVGPPENLSIS